MTTVGSMARITVEVRVVLTSQPLCAGPREKG
jgi:hypothetical protein